MRPTKDPVMEKATTLEGAVANLNPGRPLQEGELYDFYVERLEIEELLDEIMTRIEQTSESKFLLSGHRGAGKSSALSKLAQVLSAKGDFWVVHFSTLDKLDLNDLSYPELIFTLAVEILESCKDKNLKIRSSIVRQLEQFSSEVVQEKITETKLGADLKGEVKLEAKEWLTQSIGGLLSFGMSYGKNATTRNTIRTKYEKQFSDLLAVIDGLAQAIREEGKRLVCLIDGPDKAGGDIPRKLFYENGFSLSLPNCTIIYTFPNSLQYTNDFPQLEQYFAESFPMPNFKLHRRGEDNTGDIEANPTPDLPKIKEVIERRVESTLFDSDAIKLVAKYSGGIVRMLLQLAQNACVRAKVKRSDKVTVEYVEYAIQRERQVYQRILNSSQKDLLRKLRSDPNRQIDPDQKLGYLELLHNLSVIEYEYGNGKFWYDVHPIVVDLL